MWAAGHLQLLWPAVGVWAGLPLPGSAGRAANTAAYLNAEGSEGSKTGREVEMQKKNRVEIPQGRNGIYVAEAGKYK